MKKLIENNLWSISSFLQNSHYNFNKENILTHLPEKFIDEAIKVISSWKSYSPTPLIKLNKLNKELNLKNIYYKDEDKRFELKSFKALGGAFAVYNISSKNKNIIVSTATAGNHGRSVAWGAQRLGLKCKIFISENVSESRAIAMSNLGADVIRVTHVFLQAGVGGMAAAMIAGFAKLSTNIPKFIIIEPENADCVFQSIKNNTPTSVDIKKETVMGGMSCGDVSSIAWEILKNSTNFCLTIPDKAVSTAVALLADARLSDEKIIAGECAVPGLIAK